MGTLMWYINNIIIIFSIIFILIFVYRIIISVPDNTEKLVRALSAGLAVFIYTIASKSGIAIPDLIFQAIDISGGFLFKAINLFLPGFVSSIIVYFFLRAVTKENSNEKSLYLLIFLSILLTVSLIDLQIYSWKIDSKNSIFILNGSFITGIVISIIFNSKYLASLSISKNNITPSKKDQKKWKDEY
ncbi:hypothetical protein [Marinomonas shanghaiensis]|uniref:hypothetical protein n=1 Tax=Marinomonas shanghaiensis TaxID=2202418 RepID=UPI003A9104F6